jgi:hypothetical protein
MNIKVKLICYLAINFLWCLCYEKFCIWINFLILFLQLNLFMTFHFVS